MTLPKCAYPPCNNTVNRKGKKYCSLSCAGYDRGRKNREKWPTFYCKRCGKAFKVKPCLQGKQKYCSIECKRQEDREFLKKQVGKKHPLFVENILTCENCGLKFQKAPSLAKHKHKFCSKKCYLEYSNVIITCRWCGRKIKKQRNHASASFCNKECYGQWLSHNRCGENHPNWKGGWEPYYGANWQRQRRACKERDNSTCQRCGVTELEIGSKNMDVHHIIPFMESHDNSLNNLITLCDTCHHAIEGNADFNAAKVIASRAASISLSSSVKQSFA